MTADHDPRHTTPHPAADHDPRHTTPHPAADHDPRHTTPHPAADHDPRHTTPHPAADHDPRHTTPHPAADHDPRHTTPHPAADHDPRHTTPHPAADHDPRHTTPHPAADHDPRHTTPHPAADHDPRHTTPHPAADHDPRRATPRTAGAPAQPSPSAPAITVVVPTRDRPQDLARCLRALAEQTVPIEVIVVDDGSETPQKDLPGVRVIRQPPSGPAAARNTGARHATTPKVLFTDDDCAPDPTWAELLAAALDHAPAAAGMTCPAPDAPATATAWHAIVDHLRLTEGFAPSCNLGARRPVPPFDERFPHAAGEDRDWCARTAVVHVPDAKVVHHQQLTIRDFARQQYRYGAAARRFHRDHDRKPRIIWGPPLVLLAQLAAAIGYVRAAGGSTLTGPSIHT